MGGVIVATQTVSRSDEGGCEKAVTLHGGQGREDIYQVRSIRQSPMTVSSSVRGVKPNFVGEGEHS